MELMQGVEFSHWIISNFLEQNKVLVDATCGRGKDTLFLSKHLDADGKIYAFDIQKEAIQITKDKFASLDKRIEIEFIQDDHQKIAEYVNKKADGIIYNLGFLPGSDKNIKTEKETTLNSLNEALDVLADKGLIVLVIYSEHPGGQEEKEAVLDFAANLNYKNYNVLHYNFINQKKNPPEVIVIKKRGE
ncbi:MAG: class I SAM-dependent methyltransferase [Halanaerobiales bacterium]|nr:class I SAM-dependent methyltransferase [Halanaerobiales bacterium]